MYVENIRTCMLRLKTCMQDKDVYKKIQTYISGNGTSGWDNHYQYGDRKIYIKKLTVCQKGWHSKMKKNCRHKKQNAC